MIAQLRQRFYKLAPAVDFCSLRLVREQSERLQVSRGVAEAPHLQLNQGLMITVIERGGLGYAATSDFSEAGLKAALAQARSWAETSRRFALLDFSAVLPEAAPQGEYHSAVEQPWESLPVSAKLELLQTELEPMHADERMIDWQGGLHWTHTEQYYWTVAGGEVVQSYQRLAPELQVTATDNKDVQQRSMSGMLHARQGGLETLQQQGFYGSGARLAEEVLQLLAAPNCPSGKLDLLLAPDQMILQLHESIGHPLELDRILGDERNYAGTSFVTEDMFGSYRYGSDLLNVSFDPGVGGELASFAFDDEGQVAEKVLLIKNGILQRPLGAGLSQQRAGLSGTANARACDWRRPPIDRMANLNLEPGDTCFEDMIRNIESGILMRTNSSWSIDDSRNKFQFGCEWGQLIRDGELGAVVKNPNYRGVSSQFWRSLKQVGDARSWQVLGTANCGKGEPNQMISVGHAVPACHFEQIEVFGGDAD